MAGLVNPADIGSRGVSPGQLVYSNLRWEGSDWLKECKNNWPQKEPIAVKEEMKKAIVVATTGTVQSVNAIGQVINIERFSSLGTLRRVNAYVKRFISV